MTPATSAGAPGSGLRHPGAASLPPRSGSGNRLMFLRILLRAALVRRGRALSALFAPHRELTMPSHVSSGTKTGLRAYCAGTVSSGAGRSCVAIRSPRGG